ncbi:MAG: exodeoxyribonuclease VII large subunit [Acidobacteria bacterium]|nr:exodeoxyribonuclease VII large subunit [Acidobacteriota bacterium]
MAEPLLAKLTTERPMLTVTQLTQQIKTLLEGQFRDVWVRGEISNFKRHTSGHWYFTLKDATAQLRCASFRMQNRLIKFSPEDGLEVYARGRLSVYDQRGEYQLIVEYLEPVGVGSLQLAFDQLKARLAGEGLFDLARKRPLPLLPRKVGVITSSTGAALRDMLRILKRRNSGVSVLICPVPVQGEGAARHIAQGIEFMSQREDLDVLIVGRGGGSIEDLWAFNEEIVARAIFASRIPVISAVGHETDFTIADFVADLRAPTPSAAAELVAARRDELVDGVAGARQRLIKALHFKLATLRHRVSELQARRGFGQATGVLQQYIQRVDDLEHRLQMSVSLMLKVRREQYMRASRRMAGLRLRERLAHQRGRVAVYEQKLLHALRQHLEAGRREFQVVVSKLSVLSPLDVLERGYAIVWGPAGEILRQASDVVTGDPLRIKLARGQLTCTTQEVIYDDKTS